MVLGLHSLHWTQMSLKRYQMITEHLLSVQMPLSNTFKHATMKAICKFTSHAPSKFGKNWKILHYFNKNHGYKKNSGLLTLQDSVRRELAVPGQKVHVDLMLCKSIKQLDLDGILSLMNAWGTVKPETLRSSIFYHSFFKITQRGVWKSADWNHLTQIMHFLGYLNGEQDSKKLMINILHTINNSPGLHTAPYQDVCIICEAAFRSSTGITNPAIRSKIVHLLENHIQEMTLDTVWLVMILKMMIFSKFLDHDLLRGLIRNWIKSGLMGKIPFTAKVYVMNLLANAQLPDENLLNIFINSIGSKFEGDNGLPRLKDVGTLLWAVSILGYKLDRKFLEDVIIPYLLSQLTQQGGRELLHLTVQSCNSLWMMGVYSKPLVDKLISVESLQLLKDRKNQRELSRYALLMDIVAVESKYEMSEEQMKVQEELKRCQLLTPSLKKQSEKRPLLPALCLSLQTAGFSEVELSYPVKFYVAGVNAKVDNQLVHVDLLDEATSLAGTDVPFGILQAKKKLIKFSHPELHHAIVTKSDLEKAQTIGDWREILRLPTNYI